jgi:hypothetical protein
MDREQLERKALTWFSDEDPAVDAAALQQRYHRCVQVFRDIVTCSAGRSNGLVSMSNRIILPPLDHPTRGIVDLSAVVRISEYNRAEPNRGGFIAQVDFTGKPDRAQQEEFTKEFCGAYGYGTFANTPPDFVQRPGSQLATPWNDARHPRPHHGNLKNEWNRETLRDVEQKIGDMLTDAESTQGQLIDALHDKRLNPKFAAQADLMFPLPTTP